MEYFSITTKGQGFHIEGFPEAVKALRLTGKKPQRLADLALHKFDLDFALECLDSINQVGEDQNAIRKALWQSAIIHFVKCFGDSKARFSLNSNGIYKAMPDAREPFEYFKSLRNKHVIHDENSYTQCLPGAVLNNRDMDFKIAKIICLSMVGETLSQENYSNLKLLITQARDWVDGQFNELCAALTSELEAKPYDELFAIEGITHTVPKVADVNKVRIRT